MYDNYSSTFQLFRNIESAAIKVRLEAASVLRTLGLTIATLGVILQRLNGAQYTQSKQEKKYVKLGSDKISPNGLSHLPFLHLMLKTTELIPTRGVCGRR